MGPQKRAALRWVVTAGLLAVVAVLIGQKVAASWQGLSAYRFRLSWVLVGVALLAAAGYYFCNAQAWRYAVRRSGGRVSVGQAYRLYALSLFGRYVPGKAWLALVRMELGARLGIARTTTAVAVVYENGMFLITGAALSALVGAGLFARHLQTGISTLLAAGLCLAGLAPPVFYRLLNAMLRAAGKEPIPRHEQLRFRHLATMIVFFAGVWVCGGASLYALGVGLDPNLAGKPLQLGLIFVVSQIIGFVALFAPGGLGVREAAQIYLLEQITTPEQAILLPLLSRLLMIVVEVVQAGLLQGLLGWRRGPRALPGRQPLVPGRCDG